MKNYPYDSSQLKEYMACPFKYCMKFIIGRDQLGASENAFDLEFGRRFHNFLELYYKRQKPNIVNVWTGYNPPHETQDKTIEGGKILCRDYHRQWAQSDQELEILDVEKVIKINGISGVFLVKLDTIVQRGDNVFSLEHKTASTINDVFFSKFDRDVQMMAQVAAIQQEYGKCSGVIVNACRVKNYKRKTGQFEVGFNTQFERRIVSFTPEEINDFKLQVNSWIEKMETSKKTEQYAKALGGPGCSSFRGCPYKEICSLSVGMDIDEYILNDLYEPIDEPIGYLMEDITDEQKTEWNLTT